MIVYLCKKRTGKAYILKQKKGYTHINKYSHRKRRLKKGSWSVFANNNNAFPIVVCITLASEVD